MSRKAHRPLYFVATPPGRHADDPMIAPFP